MRASSRHQTLHWVGAALLLAATSACSTNQVVSPANTPVAAPSTQTVYRVGFLASLTGPNAHRGIASQAAVQLAVDELNDAGGIGGRAVHLIVEDDAGDASQAVAGLKDIAKQGAVAVIGPTTNAAAMAVLAVEDEASLPAVSLASDPSQFESNHRFVYGVAPWPGLVATGLLSYLHRSGIHNIALVRETGAYGMAATRELQQQGPDFGVRVVLDETYAVDDTDFSHQLGTVKNTSSVEAVLVWGSDETAAPAYLTRQFHQLGLSIPLLLTVDQADPTFLQAAGSSADGAILEVGKAAMLKYLLPADRSRQELVGFTTAYKQATGSDPDRYAAMAYDAVHILAATLPRAGDAPDRLMADLDRLSYAGIQGPYVFTTNAHAGLQTSALAIATVRNGEFVPIQPNCDGCAETTSGG